MNFGSSLRKPSTPSSEVFLDAVYHQKRGRVCPVRFCSAFFVELDHKSSSAGRHRELAAARYSVAPAAIACPTGMDRLRARMDEHKRIQRDGDRLRAKGHAGTEFRVRLHISQTVERNGALQQGTERGRHSRLDRWKLSCCPPGLGLDGPVQEDVRD